MCKELYKKDLWPINCEDNGAQGLTSKGENDMCYEEESETPMKDELKQSGNRHARKLIRKLSEVVDLPSVAQDSIRQELEYATLDGYRITKRHQSETETRNEDEDQRFNR